MRDTFTLQLLKNSITLVALLLSFTINSQVGINTTAPGDGSILDVESTSKGLLIPRVYIEDLSTIAPVTVSTAGEESLLVYNTNITTGKGFYYWDGSNWIALTPDEDGDFHKVGTTTAPTVITEDVFRTGKVAIGRATANSSLDVQDNSSSNAVNFSSTGSDNVLSVVRSGSKSGTARGIYVNYANGDSGNSEQIGISTWLRSGSGSGRRYGVFNNVNATVANSRQLVGLYNKLRDGNGSKYGVWNNLNSTENGDKIGVYSQTSDGTGHNQGIKNSLAGTSNSQNTGTGNYISNSGNGDHTGIFNLLSGNGNGTKIAVRNQISAGTGTNYGTYNDINNTSSGQSSYGTWNEINTSNGTNYAGWFDSFGTGGTHYAAIFNRGHVVANESGLDNDFRIEGNTDQNLFFVDASTDRIGIGTNTPSYLLDVAGDINLSGTLRNSGSGYTHPDYVFESYFDGFSSFNSEYTLKSLEQVELYLKENKHLPNIQSRADVMENGWDITEGIRDNLEKVEELYLHTIEASKKIKFLEETNQKLENDIKNALKAIDMLNKRIDDLEAKRK